MSEINQGNGISHEVIIKAVDQSTGYSMVLDPQNGNRVTIVATSSLGYTNTIGINGAR